MHTTGVASFEKGVQKIDEKNRSWKREEFIERENNKRRSNKKSLNKKFFFLKEGKDVLKKWKIEQNKKFKKEKRRTLKRKKRKTHDHKKKEEKTLKQWNEMTRNDMRRLDATGDPRPMSVSLQPLNKQLSMKDHKKSKTGWEK